MLLDPTSPLFVSFTSLRFCFSRGKIGLANFRLTEARYVGFSRISELNCIELKISNRFRKADIQSSDLYLAGKLKLSAVRPLVVPLHIIHVVKIDQTLSISTCLEEEGSLRRFGLSFLSFEESGRYPSGTPEAPHPHCRHGGTYPPKIVRAMTPRLYIPSVRGGGAGGGGGGAGGGAGLRPPEFALSRNRPTNQPRYNVVAREKLSSLSPRVARFVRFANR